MSRVLHGMPVETLPDSGDLEMTDQIIAYKADTGKAYRSTVGGLAEGAAGDVGEAFSTAKSYEAGDYVIYNDVLYRFTADKSAGSWDGSKVVATTVGSELSSISEAMADLENSMPKIQTGTVISSSVSANGNTDITVRFATAFSSTPVVMLTFNQIMSTNYGNVAISTRDVSTSGFTLRITNASSSASLTPYVQWVAIQV